MHEKPSFLLILVLYWRRIYPAALAGQAHRETCLPASFSPRLFHDGGFFNQGDIRKILKQIGIAFLGYQSLVRPLPVFRIDFFHNLHALDNFPEWSKPHLVKIGIGACVNEQLGGSGIGAGSGEGDVTRQITFLDRIILKPLSAPFGRFCGVGGQTELHNKTRNNPEESGVVIESLQDQVIETLHAQGSPCFLAF